MIVIPEDCFYDAGYGFSRQQLQDDLNNPIFTRRHNIHEIIGFIPVINMPPEFIRYNRINFVLSVDSNGLVIILNNISTRDIKINLKYLHNTLVTINGIEYKVQVRDNFAWVSVL